MQFSTLAANLSADARRAIALSHQLHFAGLVFDARSAALDLADLSTTGRREFRHILASNDQTLVGLRTDLSPAKFGPKADIDQELAKLDGVLHVAADLGAQVVCLDLGSLPAPTDSSGESAARPTITPEQAGLILIPGPAMAKSVELPRAARAIDPTFAASVDSALTALGAIADRYRMTLALGSSLASFAAIERALAAARCPWFGIDLDTVELIRDAWPTHETFSRLGSLVRHVHAHDALLGDDRRSKPAPIGTGHVDWTATLASLDASAYRGWLTVDATALSNPPRAAAHAFEHLLAIQI